MLELELRCKCTWSIDRHHRYSIPEPELGAIFGDGTDVIVDNDVLALSQEFR